MRKIFECDFCIAQILLLVSVVIEVNQKEYWGAYMTFLLAVMIFIYQVTAVRCDYWREACDKALFDLGFYKAKAEFLEYLQKMKTINNDSFKVRVWNVSGGYYLPEFYLTPAGEVCEFGVFNGTQQVRKFDNQENFRKERCTGQTDMEGRLIYENDIVNVYRSMMDAYEKAVVIWPDAESCWVCKWLKPAEVQKDCWHSSDSGTYFQGSHCRVIGNIHDDKFRDAAKMVERQNDRR